MSTMPQYRVMGTESFLGAPRFAVAAALQIRFVEPSDELFYALQRELNEITDQVSQSLLPLRRNPVTLYFVS